MPSVGHALEQINQEGQIAYFGIAGYRELTLRPLPCGIR